MISDNQAVSMPEKPKPMSKRDSALVSILERMADQLQKQDQLLEGVVKRQFDLGKSLEAVEYQIGASQSDSDQSVRSLQDSVSRYRSDMLSLVNEQDIIGKRMAELNTLVNKTTYSMETANQRLVDLEEKAKLHERTLSDHFSHSLKQADILPKEFASSNRSITKLHMDTEKNLGRMHQETQRQLEKLQQDTARRLLALSDIESALNTLLVRTEPPEKKPFWLVRVFRRISLFFRTGISRIAKWLKPVKNK